MAVGDKLVTLDGLKAVYQDIGNNINELKSIFSNKVVIVISGRKFLFLLNSRSHWYIAPQNNYFSFVLCPLNVKVTSFPSQNIHVWKRLW